MPDKSSGLSIYLRLIKYARQYRLHIAVAIFGFAMVALCGAAFTYLLQPMLDQAFVAETQAEIIWLPITIAVIFLLRSIGSYLGMYYIGRVGQLVVKQLRGEMHEKLLFSPTSYYDSTSAGTILSKFTFDVERVTWASSKSIPILVRDTLTVLSSLALMIYFSWKLTLVLMVVAPVVALVVNYATKRFRRLSKKIQLSVGDISSRVEEVIGGHSIVKLFTAEDHEKKYFAELNAKNCRNQTKVVATKAINTPLVQLILGLAFALVIYVAFLPAVKVDLTQGTFAAFVAAVMGLLNSARKLTTINEILQAGVAASISVFGLIDQPDQKNEGRKTLQDCKGIVEFKDVSFTYPKKDETALQNINFSANQGEMIAFVGKSGSGKSTLVKLIPRFYDIEQGEITLDGESISDLRMDNLRRNIAMVSQDIILFNDTVENNIAYAMPEKTQEEIYAAAKRAHASEFIEKFPDGYATMVGDRGILLSGGQRQRIAIARALLKDAPILIFDEATSSLDSESEFHIQQALKEAAKDRTTFVIAHRLSTIESADKIIVMDQGEIVECGSHSDLIQQNGVYASLYHRQFKQASTQVVNG